MKKRNLLFCLLFFSLIGMAKAGYAIIVVVYNSTNLNPIPKAKIILYDESGSPIQTAYTNDVGRADLAEVPNGLYTIEVIANGYTSKKIPFKVENNWVRLDIGLTPISNSSSSVNSGSVIPLIIRDIISLLMKYPLYSAIALFFFLVILVLSYPRRRRLYG
ncbi:MAG: carboxypeptidase-like regulatory domain-containing protein [Candidatus Bathyarchaeia archaeon]